MKHRLVTGLVVCHNKRSFMSWSSNENRHKLKRVEREIAGAFFTHATLQPPLPLVNPPYVMRSSYAFVPCLYVWLTGADQQGRAGMPIYLYESDDAIVALSPPSHLFPTQDEDEEEY